MKTLSVGLLSLATIALSAPLSQAQKWADLKMKVVLNGEIPEPALLKGNDPKCTMPAAGTPSEELVVNPDNRGIANIIFWVDTRKTKLSNDNIHPDLKTPPAEKPVLDNKDCVFVPHVMKMRVGQVLEIKNSDKTGHNAKMAFFNNKEINPMIPAESSQDINSITTEETAPTKVECNVHSWMNAWVFVTAHPYVGISDSSGVIEIPKLPAGVPLDFKIWHEKQDKSIQEVTVNGKSETWSKGIKSLNLKEGTNDLGTVVIDVARFKK
jgi:plastocyanin